MVLAILTTVSASAIFQKVNIHGGLSVSGEALDKFFSRNFCVCGCTTDFVFNQRGFLADF